MTRGSMVLQNIFDKTSSDFKRLMTTNINDRRYVDVDCPMHFNWVDYSTVNVAIALSAIKSPVT